jgi:broad specificity phosphatase PhoE
MAAELYLLRHGATEWARNGRHTGRTDLPLLAEGEAEASALAPALTAVAFDAVLVSPLQRARRTAELAGLGAGAQISADLMEWDYGDYEGITTAAIRSQQPAWSLWSDGCPGGEQAHQVQIRCERLIEQALAIAPAGRVALVAHGHILRALAGTWLGLGAQGGALLSLATATVSVLGFEREQRVILRWNSRLV